MRTAPGRARRSRCASRSASPSWTRSRSCAAARRSSCRWRWSRRSSRSTSAARCADPIGARRRDRARRPPPGRARDRHDRAPRRGGPGPAAGRDLRPRAARPTRAARRSSCGAAASRSRSRSTACWASRRSWCGRSRIRWSRSTASRGRPISATAGPRWCWTWSRSGGRLLGESTRRSRRVSDLHVVFKIADAEYVLPAADVLQMESFAGATPVPGAASDVAGLIQIRGPGRAGAGPARGLRARADRRPRSTRASSSCSRASARSGCWSTARARC